MPDVEWNKKYWNEEYQWPMAGEEWSKQWGRANSVVVIYCAQNWFLFAS